MADTVNFLQNGYSGEVLEDLLTYTVQGNDTVREAPEPTLSENIIKLQIIDNHILYTMQSKSKSF